MNNLHVEGHVHRQNVEARGWHKPLIEPDGKPLIAQAMGWFLLVNAVFWGGALYVVYG